MKVTGPDGKDFTLYFDKETGLPVRLVAKVAGLDGRGVHCKNPHTAITRTSAESRRPPRLSIKRDGEQFLEAEITDFKVLDKVPADTFAEPK